MVLISWLHKKPADLGLHCFTNISYKSLKKYALSASIRADTVYTKCTRGLYFHFAELTKCETCVKRRLKKDKTKIF